MPGAVELVAVAGGGAIGAVLRHLTGLAVHGLLGRGFPWGTLAVNLCGSLAMGIAYVLLAERGLLPDAWRSFVTVGLLGAFTTFSTFSLDTIALVGADAPGRAVAYVLVSVGLCLLAAWLGILLGRTL